MHDDIIKRKEELFDKPIETFENWYNLAEEAGLLKPFAFCLATTGEDGTPRGRVVLHKGIVDDSISFYTNYESAKGKEVIENPRVSATFYWDEPVDCQVRIEGRLEKIAPELSDAYFATRPRGSKIGAWASPQSLKMDSREDLDKRIIEAEKKFEGVEDVPRPDFWGGYKIVADKYDFMLMRKDRLHDRYEFNLIDGQWVKQRLAP